MRPHPAEPNRGCSLTIADAWTFPRSHATPPHQGENMAKATCCVTRSEFLHDAKPVEVTINGIPMTAEVKEFSTGSLGWYLNGKANVKVGDKSVSVQIGMNLTIVGSKELPKE
jgi:hypothetical protein